MTLFSRLKGWRTLAFNIVAGIAPAGQVTMALIGFLLADPDLPKLILVEYLPYYSTAVALANIYLRTLMIGHHRAIGQQDVTTAVLNG